MHWKRSKLELEADLTKPTGFFKVPVGEIELSLFDDGEARIELELKIPEDQLGKEHAVLIDQQPTLCFTPEKAKINDKYYCPLAEGLEAGIKSKVQIEVAGEVWVQGTFRRD